MAEDTAQQAAVNGNKVKRELKIQYALIGKRKKYKKKLKELCKAGFKST